MIGVLPPQMFHLVLLSQRAKSRNGISEFLVCNAHGTSCVKPHSPVFTYLIASRNLIYPYMYICCVQAQLLGLLYKWNRFSLLSVVSIMCSKDDAVICPPPPTHTHTHTHTLIWNPPLLTIIVYFSCFAVQISIRINTWKLPNDLVAQLVRAWQAIC